MSQYFYQNWILAFKLYSKHCHHSYASKTVILLSRVSVEGLSLDNHFLYITFQLFFGFFSFQRSLKRYDSIAKIFWTIYARTVLPEISSSCPWYRYLPPSTTGWCPHSSCTRLPVPGREISTTETIIETRTVYLSNIFKRISKMIQNVALFKSFSGLFYPYSTGGLKAIYFLCLLSI